MEVAMEFLMDLLLELLLEGSQELGASRRVPRPVRIVARVVFGLLCTVIALALLLLTVLVCRVNLFAGISLVILDVLGIRFVVRAVRQIRG